MLLDRNKCHSCSAALDAREVDEPHGVAQCSQCGSAFVLPRTRATPLSRPGRLEVDLPSQMDRSEMGGQLILSRRWRARSVLFDVVTHSLSFALWLALAVHHGMTEGPLAILVVLGGLGMIYSLLAFSFNRTWLTAGPSHVTVTHAPLPWYGAKQVSTRNISQVFCEKEARSAYSVAYVRKDGGRVTLLDKIESLKEALYIEQEIERHLGIEDEPVAAEVPRNGPAEP